MEWKYELLDQLTERGREVPRFLVGMPPRLVVREDFAGEEVEAEVEGEAADRIGQVVRNLRERKGWSQKALARAAGVSPNSVWGVEAGHQCPSIEMLQKITKPLNESVQGVLEAANV